jgi:uncharacterized membrane protein YfhO
MSRKAVAAGGKQDELAVGLAERSGSNEGVAAEAACGNKAAVQADGLNKATGAALRAGSACTIAAGVAFYAACALIPAAILLVCLILAGEYPFGNIHLLDEDCDLAYQYANLLAWFQNVLLGDANLLYSSGKQLGGNMFATYSYYVASPLNLLLVFFPQGAIEDFYFFVRLLRTALCGIAIAVFVRHRLPGVTRPVVLALAIGYALCQYNVVQATNILWLDAPILVPLVALGVWRFVAAGRMKLFVVALAIAIWSCWYTGYMLVIASLFFFVLEFWLQSNAAGGKFPWRKFVGKLFKFGLVLLLIAAATAVILAPSVYGLLSGKGDQLESASKIARCWPWDFFSAFLPLNFKYNWQRPQLFCGTLALGALLMLLFTSKVKKRDRIAFAVMLFALLLCMFVSALDRVWTGFTDGNNYYCRWAFVVEFFLVFAAAYSLNKGLPSRKEALRVLGCMLAVGVIALVLGGFNAYGYAYANSFIEAGSVENQLVVACFSFFSRPVCFVVFAVTCMGLFALWALAKRGISADGEASCSPFAAKAAAVLLVLLVSVEVGINAFSCIAVDEVVCRNVFGGNYTEYYDEAEEGYDALQASDSGLYRVDKTYSCIHDHTRFRVPTSESLVLGYMPLSSYLSTNDSLVGEFMGNMGYMPRQTDAPEIIQGTYPAPVLPSDSLLGLRYVATSSAVDGYENTGIASGGGGGQQVGGEEHYWYKNNYAFPLAFGVGQGATQSIGTQSDAFTYQNKLFQVLFGTSEEMYAHVQATKTTSDETGVYWQVGETSSSNLCYAEVRSTTSYADYFWDGFQLSIGGNKVTGGYYHSFTYGIVPTGGVYAGEEITLTGNSVLGSDENMQLYLVETNSGLLSQLSQQANAKAATFNEFRDGYISASYTAGAEDAYLFMSVPYDAGWTVKVNGEMVQPETVGDCLMAIPVTQGENNVELSYCSPMLMQGAAVSIAAWLGILVFMAVRALRKRATK